MDHIELWDKAKALMREELANVSYTTWIEQPLKPVYVVDDADAFFASLPEPRIEGEKADEERGAADADDDAGMRQGGDPAGEDGAEAGDAEQDADAHGGDAVVFVVPERRDAAALAKRADERFAVLL